MGIPYRIELSERVGHEAIISLLNQYFTRLAEPISEAGGFIDSFRGDEVMPLFGGTPESAVEAGIGMHRALERFNLEIPDDWAPLRMGRSEYR